MIPVVKLKQNLRFNKDLGELIEVMKLAATLQFNQFRLRRQPANQFSSLLESALKVIASKNIKHRLLEPAGDLPKAIILVSSDEGFLGELNVLLVNSMIGVRGMQDQIIAVGSQGADYLDQLGIKFNSLSSPGEKIDYKQIQDLRDDIFKRFLTGEIGGIHIVYPRFLSLTVQEVESETLLPLPELPAVDNQPENLSVDFIIEPDFDSVIRGWVKLWLGAKLYQIFWTAKLAEYAARIMHLESSIQELNRVNHQLKLEYFKFLHTLSDTSIREISSSRMAAKH